MLRDGSGSERQDPPETGKAAAVLMRHMGVYRQMVAHEDHAADEDADEDMAAHVGVGARCNLGTSALVRQQVIPRLVAAHAGPLSSAQPGSAQPGNLQGEAAPEAALPPGRPPLDPDTVADIALDQDAFALLDRLEAALQAGACLEDLMVDVLAPAARALGTRWEADLVDFVEVTMALWRLQEAVHALSSRRRAGPADASTCRVLCAVAPGDDHGFGSVLLEEMFVRAGWAADGCRGASADQLLAHVAGSWFDLIALTATVDQPIARLRDLVAALRKASANPAVGILVGGRFFSVNPGLHAAIGADATATDAREAIATAAAVVSHLAPQRAARPYRSRYGRGDMAMPGIARLD